MTIVRLPTRGGKRPRHFAPERDRRARSAARAAKVRTTITRPEYRAIMRLQAITELATREIARRLNLLGLDVAERVTPRGPLHWPSRLDDLAWGAGVGDVTDERDHEAFALEVIALTDDVE